MDGYGRQITILSLTKRCTQIRLEAMATRTCSARNSKVHFSVLLCQKSILDVRGRWKVVKSRTSSGDLDLDTFPGPLFTSRGFLSPPMHLFCIICQFGSACFEFVTHQLVKMYAKQLLNPLSNMNDEYHLQQAAQFYVDKIKLMSFVRFNKTWNVLKSV